MSIKKLETGKWRADVRPDKSNRNHRKTKTFSTRSEAQRWVSYIENQAANEAWNPRGSRNEKLSDLVKLWHDLHGKTLAQSGQQLEKLLALCAAMGDIKADKLTKKHFTDYRQERLKKVSVKTINNEHGYLNAVFNELVKMEQWHINPISGLKKLKYNAPEMGFLTDEQIKTLLFELEKSRNNSVLLVAKICLSTGCRWSEAQSLKINQLISGRIRFIKTKSGKVRTIPVNRALYDEIKAARVAADGSLFESCYQAFTKAVQRAKITLPAGQLSHVLRHTFASHFMTKGGNILVLQQILGHSSITDTMKYSHFSPNHLEDAITLNPLAG